MNHPIKQQPYPIIKEGWPFVIISALFAILGIFFESPSIFYFGLGLTIFVAAFFRNPTRFPPQLPNGIISPADGTIIFIGEVHDNRYLQKRVLKVSIFMSVFDVHVNRIPINGTVKNIIYNKGKFFAANRDKASLDNEQNATIVETASKQEVVFVQIAGLIARRIVSYLHIGEKVNTGDMFGLIRFGSRTDLYLPLGTKINVTLKDKVKGAQTVIGELSA